MKDQMPGGGCSNYGAYDRATLRIELYGMVVNGFADSAIKPIKEIPPLYQSKALIDSNAKLFIF